MAGPPSMPSFPIDFDPGLGVRVSRRGTKLRIDVNDAPIRTGGTGRAFTIATGRFTGSIPDGTTITLLTDRDATGSPTLNVDGTGDQSWVDSSGSPLSGIAGGRFYRVTYEQARNIWRSNDGRVSGEIPDIYGLPGALSARTRAGLTRAAAQAVQVGTDSFLTPEGTLFVAGNDPSSAPLVDASGASYQVSPLNSCHAVVDGYGARNEVGRVANPADDTLAYQRAIDRAQAARALGIDAHVAIGTGSPNIGSPLARGNNLLFRGSRHAAVNNNLPGLGDLLAMSQSYDIRQVAMDLRGNGGGGSANQWVDYVAAEIRPSASPAAHEKAARLTIVNHADPSDWSSPTICTVPRDGVGHQIIVNANADLTRAYGQHIIVKSEPGVRTFGNCLELEWHNRAGDAFSERRQGTYATRSVIGCVAANGVITNGVAFVGSDYAGTGKAGTYENAIFASYAALDNWLIKCGLASPAATELDDWFSIHKSGVVTIGQSGLDPSGAAIWVHRSQNRPNAAGNQNAVIKLQADSDAQAYTTFVRTGQVAWSFGFDMGANIMVLASQEGLGGNRILSASNKAVAIGSGAPQDCGASNVLFLSQAAAPFANGNNPSGGVAMIFDGANIILKRPDGKTLILNNWS